MSRKRGHQRHGANPTSWAYTIARQWDMDPKIADKIVLGVRIAYQRLREGNGDGHDFDKLASALNVALMRAEKIGQPVVDGIASGMGALIEADRGDRFVFTGPGIIAMNCAVDLYEEILRNSTPRQMQEAVDEGARRMRAGQVRQTGAGDAVRL